MKKMKKTILTLACIGLAFAGIGAYQATATKTVRAQEANPVDFACAGASIRIDSNPDDGIQTGIRFRIKMKTELLNKVGADRVNVLVMPTDLLGDGVLDINDTDAQRETLIDWRDFVNDDKTTDPTYQQAYAYIYGMSQAEYNRPTTWRAYYMDGETPVYCAQMERSVSEVALNVENDENATQEIKDKVEHYILNYTVTYDHGVRGADGKWKTTTETVRYGTEIEELQPAPITDEREDFEFLAWKTTKGADKIREKDGKTIVTGNITKEAYWLLTGEIALDSANDVYKYADFSSKANTTVKENPTGNGVAFASAWGTQSG
ncbi:MAG: InlB B-repeat-containing protein, partial [Clostridia bacterium]|nr:InlB B-repeat-containing protein [Clostridia bacterium]